ncbi:MAG TPA: septum formation initiator family protein [Firmicutes bacterium]|nr:septum formation initiator family protein [Candidatus Fermentithermobacillaceae bacterium]
MNVREPKKRRPVVPVLGVVVLFLAVAVSFVLRQAEVNAASRKLAALKAEIERYQALNVALEQQIELLKTDEHIERIARDKLGLVKAGEVQYMFVNDKNR